MLTSTQYLPIYQSSKVSQRLLSSCLFLGKVIELNQNPIQWSRIPFSPEFTHRFRELFALFRPRWHFQLVDVYLSLSYKIHYCPTYWFIAYWYWHNEQNIKKNFLCILYVRISACPSNQPPNFDGIHKYQMPLRVHTQLLTLTFRQTRTSFAFYILLTFFTQSSMVNRLILHSNENGWKKWAEQNCSHKSDWKDNQMRQKQNRTEQNGTEQNKTNQQNRVNDIYINLSLRFRKMKCL